MAKIIAVLSIITDLDLKTKDHGPREIYVMEIVLHNYDVINGSFLHYLRPFLCTLSGRH